MVYNTADDELLHGHTLCWENQSIFVMGDLARARPQWIEALTNADTNRSNRVVFVEDYSVNDDRARFPNSMLTGLGRLPIQVHGVGVLFKKFFSEGYFHKVQAEHEFQALAFSNKPGIALRTGIYLTPVKTIDNEKHFQLLRCSTNLAGPTADFQKSDFEIVDALNEQASSIFENAAPVNHVLAQLYHNHWNHNNKRQRKAAIKAHSDKTKDMPRNGIMAFCTFYDGLGKLRPLGPFDFGHKRVSGLTKLQFYLEVRP